MIGLIETIFYQYVILASRDAAILSLILALVLLVVGKRISPAWRHALCLLIAVRLLIPVLPSSTLSWQALIPGTAEVEVVSLPVDSTENITQPIKSSKPSFVAPSRMQIFALIWLSGFVLILSITCLQYWRFGKRVRLLRAFDDEGIERVTGLLKRFVEDEKLCRSPVFVITDGVRSPAIMGIFRPRILLPPKLVAELSDAQICFVLRHELAHFQRHDVWTNWLLVILQAIHWFNPIIWWAFHRTRIEAERATDARVMQNIGQAQATNYGDTLIRILEQTFAKRRTLIPGVIGVAESRRDLKTRIALIASFNGTRHRLATVVAFGLFMAIATVGLTQAPKAEEVVKPNSQLAEKTEDILKVSLPKVEFRDEPLSEVLKWLESKFPENGPKFVVEDKVDQSREITLVLSNAPIAEVLRFSTSLTSTEYRIDESSIIISTASSKPASSGKAVRRSNSAARNSRGFPFDYSPPSLKEIASDYLIHEFSVTDKSLSDALDQLIHLSKEVDEDGKGIEILVSKEIRPKRNLTFTLRGVSIYTATDHMAKEFGAVTRIKDGKIWIVPEEDPNEPLLVNTWKVLPMKFAGKDPKEVLLSAGIEFPVGSAAAFIEEKNQLVVRLTKANCEEVEAWLNESKTMAPR